MTAVSSPDALSRTIQAAFIASLGKSVRRTIPYRYWLLADVLPAEVAHEVVDLPIEAAPAGKLVLDGRRDTNNASRTFFGTSARQRFPVARALAEAFQSSETVAAIERECDTNLAGTNLRIEFCQDNEGFWLEPHTDIGPKKFTMSLFLCQGDGADDLGTDIFDAEKQWAARAPSPFNAGMLFIPSKISFHGFQNRSFKGLLRKSLIINYVTQEFRSRHELAYPETPVRGIA
jgi:hypothetical protein